MPFPGWRDATIRLDDLLSPAGYQREGNELLGRGLYLDLPPWGYHVFEIGKEPSYQRSDEVLDAIRTA